MTEEGEVNAAAGCWVTLRTCAIRTTDGVRFPDCRSTHCNISEHYNHCWGLWNEICS